MSRKFAVSPLFVCCVFLSAQTPPPEPNPISASQVVIHLTRTIAWYQHTLAVDDGASTVTENVLLRNNAREFAKRALASSFAFARAEAAVLSANPIPEDTPMSAPATMQTSLTKSANRVARLQQRLQSLDSHIEQSAGSERASLTDERAAIAADLTLAKQMETAVKTITAFSSPRSTASHGLLDVINSLESLNPVTTTATSDEKQKQPNSSEFSAYHPESTGIVVLASRALSFYNARRQIETVSEETSRLSDEVDGLRAPLRKSIRAIVAESDAISNSEDSALQASDWANTAKQIADLSVKFKQLSTVVIPLGETAMSLQSAHGSLNEWHKQLDTDYESTFRYLIIRIGALLGGAVLILLGSAIWQRAIYRYITEPRRRRQLLLVKRVVVGIALAVLITFGFFSSLSSIATLLGFITAGLALALQNVILSAVAYFFLIGKYGLRVGDRVTVQGVTGEVIEVGLIRLFLMEMVGSGTDLHPTGRLAVFANSVIFQPSALMKQAPGLDYTWHAASVTIEDQTDYQQARMRLTEAVSSVYQSYRQAIEQQHKAFELSTQIPTSVPMPNSRTQFTEHGLEITIRYPVSLNEQPGHIDEQMVDGLIAEAAKEPPLKFAPGGSPKTSQVA